MCFLRHGQSALAGLVLAAACGAASWAEGTPGAHGSVDAAPALELMMVRQAGCSWCEEWDEEIGPIYAKTEEGKRAPLREVDIFEMPLDLALDRPARFTPTFVLLRDGAEIGRIEGYPGEDFFWGLLARLLEAPPQDSATPVEGGTTK